MAMNKREAKKGFIMQRSNVLLQLAGRAAGWCSPRLPSKKSSESLLVRELPP